VARVVRRRWRLAGIVAVVALISVGVAVFGYDVRSGAATSIAGGSLSPHHVAGGYRNLSSDYSYTMLDRAKRLVVGPHLPKPAKGLSPVANDGKELRANGTHPTVTWIGHATFLVQLDGVNILTDPHWGDSASPVAFAGPHRLTSPGIRFENLPKIDAVVISHDHYDHLDEPTVMRLAREHHPRFFVPLGLKSWLADRGIDDVVELDWWDQVKFRDLTFVCTPAQHSSGRTFRDQNQRLWSSWVIEGAKRRLYFAGDTGYDPALSSIKRLGPFDVVLIPIGGYSSYGRRHPNHVNPEEAVQLFQDVGGRLMVPMHWGTFDMNREPTDEPPKRVMAEAHRRGLDDRIAVLHPGQTIPW
jgi:N-acyl-phosphatidylethanolamine-hydrolysing phospholipase D